jgi:DNA-binding NtrC family response regulator
MNRDKKKILIVDEAGFSRICSAILEKEGYGTSAVSDVRHLESGVDCKDFGLVITSYPYGAGLFGKFRDSKIPTIILSDRLNSDLVASLDDFDKSMTHCMIKPLDYTKFRSLINQVMARDAGRVLHDRDSTGDVMHLEMQ